MRDAKKDAAIDSTVSEEELELERAVDAYATAKGRGTAPPVEQFVTTYPRIADRLRACLSGLAAADAVAAGMREELPARLGIPEHLGEFQVICELGRGGMGEVYRAKQVSLNRPVALKVLPRNWGWTPTMRKRFHREAQAAGKLHHTNIVAVYAEGEQDGVCYYAMELIEGPSLDQIIGELRRHQASDAATISGEESGISLAGGESTIKNAAGETAAADSSGLGRSSRERFDTIAKWIAAVADALDYAHEQGVIHRDVKPSNLMVGKDGRVRLTDFGLARVSEESGMTMTGEMLGTPRYMSPEQVAAGRVKVDARTDIYSLGATLYELLTLRPPFPGRARDQIISQIISKDPKRPRSIDPAIPTDLETICLKALEKDASRRYQTATEMAEDLRRYVNRYAINARRAGPLTRMAKWAKRRPGVAVLAAGLLVTAAVAGILGWKANNEQSQRLAEQETHSQQITAERLQNVKDQALAEAMFGDVSRAERAVRQAQLLGADRGWVRLLEGLIAHSRSNVEDAKAHLEHAVNLMPNSLAANALLGRLLTYYDSFEAGRKMKPLIDSLTRVTYEDLIFSGYYYSVYEPYRALEVLDTAIQQRDSAVARLIRVDALSHFVHMGNADVADRAIRDADAAYAWLPDNQLAMAKCIEAYTVAANACALTGDEEKREEYLARAGELVARMPDDPIDQLLFHTACYWDRKGDLDQALLAWERAANSGWARSVKHYICELYRQGRFSEALRACDLARENDEVTNIDVVRVLLLAETGDKQGAQAELERLAGHPDMDPYLSCVARILGRSAWADKLIRNTKLPDNPVYLAFMEFGAGTGSADDMLAAAADGPDPYTAAMQVGEAHFHIAHRALAEGDRGRAANQFKLMEDLNCYYFYEYRWARAFRERLESDPDWPASIRLP